MNSKQSNTLHLGIAEQGKIHALAGEHQEALRHYREAIKLVQQQAAPEIFFQHYTQCVLESLERSGAYNEVIAYCEKLLCFLAAKPLQSPFIKAAQRTIQERLGVQYLHQKEIELARATFQKAVAQEGTGKLPLSEQFLGWLIRGYHLTEKQIRDTLDRHHYFSVRSGKVNPAIAISIPKTTPTPLL